MKKLYSIIPNTYVDDFYKETGKRWDEEYQSFLEYVKLRVTLDILNEIRQIR
jgi:hypothetical protein